MKVLKMTQSKADPCLYYKWTDKWGLVIWLSWVDDLLICGPKDAVFYYKQQMMTQWECDEQGELKEYIGCKIDCSWDEGWMHLTQPVLLQSFKNEFDLPEGKTPVTPMPAGETLVPVEEEHKVGREDHAKY